MITKQVIKIKLHFDNFQECEHYQEIYKEKGYKIICSGSADDWYFEGELIEGGE